MNGPNPEAIALADRLAALYTPVVADVLDRLGYRDQCPQADIRPLSPAMRCAGVVRTVRTIVAPTLDPPEPYKGEMEAVDALKAGDVMVVSRCEWSFWGELLSTAARYRGCRGVLIDGFTRDTQAIMAMGFPVFCRGIHPADSLGRLDVEAHDVPIEFGGVAVRTGDLVLADHDGVVFVPAAAAEEAIARAEEKVAGENLVRDKLAEGMSVTEAFRRYGVL
ncbi:RraA family protein [Tautonia sociabilis]|uniref:Putative 4-hydroxy-4-methyl-2-oxoglutarate aldolase n=1 Tax=Tautonia sociabilis TaxID=2080755 RepID=A0A432MFG0_9BACT|nr:RraA family protein [Tautonia sociabilis]RUL84676.1 RraA family protein [Tautonia sociabilis]